MAYAPDTRPFYDADAHIMELPNFLRDFADPGLRDEIYEVRYSASLVSDEEVAQIMAQGGKHSQTHVQEQLAMGDELIARSKEIQALGAFDGKDRSAAMDLLGFKKQLIFPTHSVVQPFFPTNKFRPELRYGSARAVNRHVAEFCSHDNRLMGVGVIPLDDPALAVEELDHALKLGMQSIWVPHRAPLGHSPGHVDLEPFWARLAEANVPFVIHVGGSPLQALDSWSNNGRAAVKDWMGGGENVRTKDAAVLHQPAETFITMLLMDGVFARNPNLRGAAVEIGAGWVPELLNRLDHITRIYSRADTSVRFDRTPSEQLTEQMGFTPFPHEDVARLIDHSNPDLYLFSSDYPHVEGGRDPIGKFEKSLQNAGELDKTKFYSENFLRLWPESRV